MLIRKLYIQARNLSDQLEILHIIQKSSSVRDYLEIGLIWKVSFKGRKLPDQLEIFNSLRNFARKFYTFHIKWNLSRKSGSFAHNLESFPINWKLPDISKSFKQARIVPDQLDIFHTIGIVSRQPENFPINLESFQLNYKVIQKCSP